MRSQIYEKVFTASLGKQERLLTYVVGYGVGIGVPFILGVTFAIGFSQPLLLLLPLPFMLAFGVPSLFRPTGYAVTSSEIIVIQPIGRRRIPLTKVIKVHNPATNPPGMSIGLGRTDGIQGTFGSYWNKTWGRYQVFITNQMNSVELELENGSRVILSPDDSDSFVVAVERVASECGTNVKYSG